MPVQLRLRFAELAGDRPAEVEPTGKRGPVIATGLFPSAIPGMIVLKISASQSLPKFTQQ